MGSQTVGHNRAAEQQQNNVSSGTSRLALPQITTPAILLKQWLSSVAPRPTSQAWPGNLWEMIVPGPHLRRLTVDPDRLSSDQPHWRLRALVRGEHRLQPLSGSAHCPPTPAALWPTWPLQLHPHPNPASLLFVNSFCPLVLLTDWVFMLDPWYFRGLWFKLTPVSFLTWKINMSAVTKIY